MKLLYTILNLMTFIAIGFLLKKIKLFSKETAQELNSFVFKVAFPLNIITSFYKVNLAEVINFSFFLYIAFTFFLSFCLALAISHLLHKDGLNRAVTTVAVYRGNFIIMGFPILESLLGDASLIYAGIILAISQVFYNITTAWVYEKATLAKADYKKLFFNIFKNPMLLGVLIGIFINLTNFNLYFLENPFRTIGKTATTFGLIVLGHGLSFDFDKNNLKNTIIVAFAKLLILPAIAFFASNLFNLAPIEKSTAIILFACPTAIVSYTFAKNYKADTKLAQNYVIFTTFLFMFTIYMVLKIF